MRAGLHCRDLLDKIMIGARAPIMIPPLDATETAKGCEAALRTLPVALENKRKREGRKEFGAEVRVGAACNGQLPDAPGLQSAQLWRSDAATAQLWCAWVRSQRCILTLPVTWTRRPGTEHITLLWASPVQDASWPVVLPAFVPVAAMGSAELDMLLSHCCSVSAAHGVPHGWAASPTFSQSIFYVPTVA